MLIPGSAQLYENSTAVNNPSEKVGWGIYCSPHFQECFNYTRAVTVENKDYHLVLQCRVKPEKIKVCEGTEEYWVINEPKNIRPYGILLVKEDQIMSIKSSE